MSARALWVGLALALALAPALTWAQGRYRPVGAAGRLFQKAERLQEQGDALRDEGDRDGARARYADAIEVLEEANQADPAYVDVYARLGLLYYSLGRYADALPVLEKGLARDKDNDAMRFWYGQNLLESGRVEQGVRELERVAADTDEYPEVYVVLGNYYYDAEQFQRAQPAYEQYLRLEPDALDARARLGNTYFKLKRYAEALQQYERVLTERPDDDLTRINVGISHYWTGEHARAVEVLRRALEKRPDRKSALFHLAQSHFELKQYDDALGVYERYLSLAPKSFNGQYFAGSTLLEMGRRDAAMQRLQTAAELKPDVLHPHYKMAMIHLRAGESAEAERHLRKAQSIAPAEPWVLTALGTVARQKGELEAALRHQKQAVDAAPQEGRLHANLALSLEAAGQIEAARASIDQALTLTPSDPWTRQAAARIYAISARTQARSGDAKAAAQSLERAIGLQPDDATLLADRALLRVAAGETQAALVDAKRATEGAPERAVGWYALGRARFAEGDAADAALAFARAWKIEPSPAIAAAWGTALMASDQLEVAVEQLDAAHERWPDDPSIARNRATAHYLTGAARLSRGLQAYAAMRIAVRAEDAFDPLTRARIRYALTVLALRSGDGSEARQHHSRMQSAAYAARKAGEKSSHLTPAAPSAHVDALAAHANILIGNYELAMNQLEALEKRRRKLTPYESRLYRELLDREGTRALKKGRLAAAEKHLRAAQAIRSRPTTAHNLALIAWQRGKKKQAMNTWRGLRDEVPEAIFNYAAALEDEGDHEGAWREYGRYARTNGKHAARANEIRSAKQRVFKFEEGE